MELITYREVYYEPITMIPVPKNLQKQAFEVFFAPVMSEKQHEVTSQFNLANNHSFLANKQPLSTTNLRNLVLSWDTLPEDLHDAFDFDDLPSDNAEIF